VLASIGYRQRFCSQWRFKVISFSSLSFDTPSLPPAVLLNSFGVHGKAAVNLGSINSRFRMNAILVEGLRKFLGDLRRTLSFDFVTLQHVNKLSVFQKRNRGR
jgi:hypothetical protein